MKLNIKYYRVVLLIAVLGIAINRILGHDYYFDTQDGYALNETFVMYNEGGATD